MQVYTSQNGDTNLPFLGTGGLAAAPLISGAVYNVDAQTSAIVLTAADLAGGFVEVILGLTGAITTAQNAQLPTLAALLALIPTPQIGQTYKLRVINVGGTSSGVFTLTTNTGWTLTGTMSIAVGAWRDFLITFTSLTAATIRSVGTGTNS